MGAPVGPTGCEDSARADRFFAGLSAGVTSSRLAFNNDAEDELDFDQRGATLFFGRSDASGWSFRIGAGVVAGGALTHDQMGEFVMGTGFVGSLSLSRRWTLGGGDWFADGTASLGAGTLRTTAPDDSRARYTSTDLRIGATAGRTFAERFSPYVLGRAFAGPVFWEIEGQSAIGSDTSHVQLGAGLAIGLPGEMTAVIDVSALGERAISAGVSVRL